MAGDHTRFTFDPARGYSGVHKQQGRVSLDAEFNEFEEILDRRSRAQGFDVFGPAVVPLNAPGFEIGAVVNELTIGIGRAYVDGILAECFGDLSDPTQCTPDTLLGFVIGAGPVRYTQQPFFYTPGYPALPTTAGQFALAYLDVWQREVTVFEEDRLREPALNGPDTATRVQTAWQVKLLDRASADSCATPPPAWTDLTAPSTARLTAAIKPSAPSPGACIINPAGGYTGLENRLYRVEVQKGGMLSGNNPATFKWSRDNASLGARVLSIRNAAVAGQSIIAVTSLGRDQWMRFTAGDHIELLDDDIEFAMRERGIGGQLAQIVSLNEGSNEIQVDVDLSAFVVHAAQHPRIRRWDCASNSEELQRNAVSGASMPLEDGIVITFGASGTDTLHAGDHWVFAARTADGTIDTLINAPPRGPLHHFARLAIVEVGTPGQPASIVDDCRSKWPQPAGGGCCTKIVAPTESIQDAIDSLPKSGGCVCLKSGVHPLKEKIVISQSNVHLHGESKGAEIRAQGLDVVLVISGPTAFPAEAVTVESLRITVVGDPAISDGIIVAVGSANHVGLHELELSVESAENKASLYTAVSLKGSGDVTISDNVALGVDRGVLVHDATGRVVVRDNDFMGIDSQDADNQTIAKTGVLLVSERGEPLLVEGNIIRQFRTGVAVQLRAPGARVTGNRILRGRAVAEGDLPPDTDTLRKYMDSRIYGIDFAGGLCIAQDNYIEMASALWGGIRATTADAFIVRNTLVGSAPTQTLLVPASIYCTTGADNVPATGTTVRDNLLQQPQSGVVLSRVTGVLVTGTRFNGAGHGWFGVRFDDASYSSAQGNELAALGNGFTLTGGDHNIVSDNRVAVTLVGVLANGGDTLEVRGNEITDAVMGGIVATLDTGDILLAHNRIANCGWQPFSTDIQGAVYVSSNEVVKASRSTLRIDSCEITDPGVATDGTAAKDAVRGIHAWAPNCQIVSNRVVFGTAALLDTSMEHRALLLLGPLLNGKAAGGAGSVGAAPPTLNAAIVSNNVFRGPGLPYCVELRRKTYADDTTFAFFNCVFSGNHCEHYMVKNFKATVHLSCLHVIANANHVLSQSPDFFSMDGDGVVNASIVGNITTGPINIASTAPTPVTSFNVIF